MITKLKNVLGFPIGKLNTKTALIFSAAITFAAITYFIPQVSFAIVCSVCLYVSNNFVDSFFSRGGVDK